MIHNYRVEVKLSIADINENEWNEIFADFNNPFYEYNWLKNLESSKSVSRETGWQPLYFMAYLHNELNAIAPLFLKNHSYGEFIFDQSFARLAQDLNLNYYPKLIGMSPYSPIEGYQFIYKTNSNKIEITEILIKNIEDFAQKNNILSCNFLYANRTWGQLIKNLGYGEWLNIRSEWQNFKEKDFEGFLSRFNSNQRKNIKKERKSILKQSLLIETFTGEQINKNILSKMYFFYEKHCLRWGVWGSKYLTYEFFKNSLINKNNIVIFSACKNLIKDPIAMSMCISNKERLWGRYWGASEDISNLHFELCYYQPIEWAIKNNIKYFDPGAGGNHKRRRGFQAKGTNSYHKWFNKDMKNIINNWIVKANLETLNQIKLENESIPYCKNYIDDF
tara:strand:- start:175 stop:1347 length:1173 start_codon:yes stop_codon:yes gene_type:complete